MVSSVSAAKPSAMTAAYKRQEVGVLDAAALRPPLHLLPSLAQRRGTPHPPPLAPPHRVAGRLVRAARCCPRQQPVPHSALSTGFTFKFTARIFRAQLRTFVTSLAPPPCKR